MRAILIITACILISGCDREVILQVPGPDVDLTVTAAPMAGSPANPVKITAEVVNRGTAPRSCAAGCSLLGPGMSFEILDPDSSVVYLWDPRFRPACPNYLLTFFPRERLTGVISFEGTLFGANGDSLVTQAGTYTVIVSFRSSSTREPEEKDVVENRTTFLWTTQ